MSGATLLKVQRGLLSYQNSKSDEGFSKAKLKPVMLNIPKKKTMGHCCD